VSEKNWLLSVGKKLALSIGKNWLLSIGKKLAFKCREKIGFKCRKKIGLRIGKNWFKNWKKFGGKMKNSGQKPSDAVRKGK